MRLPALLVTGFLGAGKTTLINRILSALAGRPERVALLINEFGDIGIDGRLIESGPQDIYEVNKGSIFCVCVRDDFVSALGTIAGKRDDLDFIIIEATGIAETRNLAAYLQEPPLNGIIGISRNVCVVDARNFHKIHATLRAAREQVLSAGTIILNKVNLVDEYTASLQEKLIRDLNHDAPIIRWDGGPIAIDRLVPGTPDHMPDGISDKLADMPPKGMVSVSATADGVMNMGKLRKFLSTLPDNLYRAKGILRTQDGPATIEYTPDEWTEIPYRGAVTAEENALVLIADRLDADAVIEGFRSCAGN